ncbi:hypothetical protein C8R46DRAFT_1031023 [Mycena filopes]|nr:hypothetical protein C8R46DRAFT_1031023 [Mycena filopes]
MPDASPNPPATGCRTDGTLSSTAACLNTPRDPKATRSSATTPLILLSLRSPQQLYTGSPRGRFVLVYYLCLNYSSQEFEVSNITVEVLVYSTGETNKKGPASRHRSYSPPDISPVDFYSRIHAQMNIDPATAILGWNRIEQMQQTQHISDAAHGINVQHINSTCGTLSSDAASHRQMRHPGLATQTNQLNFVSHNITVSKIKLFRCPLDVLQILVKHKGWVDLAPEFALFLTPAWSQQLALGLREEGTKGAQGGGRGKNRAGKKSPKDRPPAAQRGSGRRWFEPGQIEIKPTVVGLGKVEVVALHSGGAKTIRTSEEISGSSQ